MIGLKGFLLLISNKHLKNYSIMFSSQLDIFEIKVSLLYTKVCNMVLTKITINISKQFKIKSYIRFDNII